MLIIKLKDGEKIDRALKRYKDKHRNVGLVNKLRDRKNFKKRSVKRRDEIKKAIYIQSIKDQENN